MGFKNYAICSKHSCSYSYIFDGVEFSNSVPWIAHEKEQPEQKDDKIDDDEPLFGKNPFDEPKYRFERNPKYSTGTLPKRHFCEECGSKLLYYCPHCEEALFTIENPKFCGQCSKEIKPINYSEGVNEDGSIR
ncbi:MAG: hypothetical protein GQ532_07720 [Methylomarinum sp.]|nr:hypothetical protein [Methylomarinum sp.]